jgi:hypothetical protein
MDSVDRKGFPINLRFLLLTGRKGNGNELKAKGRGPKKGTNPHANPTNSTAEK